MCGKQEVGERPNDPKNEPVVSATEEEHAHDGIVGKSREKVTRTIVASQPNRVPLIEGGGPLLEADFGNSYSDNSNHNAKNSGSIRSTF